MEYTFYEKCYYMKIFISYQHHHFFKYGTVPKVVQLLTHASSYVMCLPLPETLRQNRSVVNQTKGRQNPSTVQVKQKRCGPIHDFYVCIVNIKCITKVYNVVEEEFEPFLLYHNIIAVPVAVPYNHNDEEIS